MAMDNAIKETNKKLEEIISILNENKEKYQTKYNEINKIINNKLEMVKEYKEKYYEAKEKIDNLNADIDEFKEEYKKPGASGFQFLDERLDENVKRYWHADLYNKYYDEFEHSRETLEMIYEHELRGNEYVNGKYVKKYELAFQDARGLKEAVEIAKQEGKDFNSLSVKDKIAYFLDGVKKIKKLDEINQQTDKEKDND